MLEDLENALAEHAPAGGELASELPPLTIDGIPVSVDKMTQVRLPPTQGVSNAFFFIIKQFFCSYGKKMLNLELMLPVGGTSCHKTVVIKILWYVAWTRKSLDIYFFNQCQLFISNDIILYINVFICKEWANVLESILPSFRVIQVIHGQCPRLENKRNLLLPARELVGVQSLLHLESLAPQH